MELEIILDKKKYCAKINPYMKKAVKVFVPLDNYFLAERGSHRLKASLSSDNY